MGERGTPRVSDGRIGGLARAATVFVALTLLLAYPLSIHPASTALPGDPDTDLMMWTLAWDAHAIVSRPLDIFDANIYYPQSTTLAYSENMIGSVPFAAPVLWLTGNPVLALNVVALLSVVLCGLGAYVLARRLGLEPAAAILCGLIFAFAPVRFFRIGQLHLTTVQWVPFGLAALHAYLDGDRARQLKLAAFCFTLQALTTGHGAVFLAMGMLGLVAWRVALGEPVEPLRRLRDLGVTGALLLLPTALVFLPYRRVQVEMGLRRSLVDWAPTPESFLASPAAVPSWLVSLAPDADVLARASSYLFPGFLPILLAAAALVLWRRGERASPDLQPVPSAQTLFSRWTRLAGLAEVAALVGLVIAGVVAVAGRIRLEIGDTLLLSVGDARRAWGVIAVAVLLRVALLRRVPFELAPRLRRRHDRWRRWAAAHRRDPVVFYGLLTLVSILLSIGPPLGIWPLVYWLPGLNFIRVPSRFMILALLGLAVLAAIGFERVAARVARARRPALAVIVGALLVGEFAAIPLPTRPYAVDIPAVDFWLDERPKPFVVAELPVDGSDRIQSTYMLHATAHWQKTVHGHSGLRPALHVELYDQLRTFPDEISLASLERLQVDYVVIHPEFYEPGAWEVTRERLNTLGDRLVLEHEDEDGGRVYSLRRR